MTDAQTIERVRELRARGLSPKEIACSLGIKRAAVTNIVRRLATERDASGSDSEQLDCLLNAGWSTGLKIDRHPEWRDPAADESAGGLVTALVTRRRRHRRGATVCVYLLDVYCLGVKNAIGPDNVDEQRLRRLTDKVFSGYQAQPITAPIELVRDLVFGAAAYAQRLGFAPHPDFEQARDHLGPWTGPSAITFGCDGKPTYISGPHDNPDRVLRTLRQAVGRKGFNYTIGIDLSDLPLTG
jgi:transcriptional regulator with XRE-family HTH domain